MFPRILRGLSHGERTSQSKWLDTVCTHPTVCARESWIKMIISEQQEGERAKNTREGRTWWKGNGQVP